MEHGKHHHPPTPSSKEEGENRAGGYNPSSPSEDGENAGWRSNPPSSSEEGVGGGGFTREVLLKRAAEMRKNPTEPERRLWMQIRTRRFLGYKFRRQAVVGFRIVDFFCPAKGLAVELDGDTHDREKDLRRDRQMLPEFGFRCMRFTNEEMMRNPDGVLTALSIALERQPERWSGRGKHHPPAPSSEEEGEQ